MSARSAHAAGPAAPRGGGRSGEAAVAASALAGAGAGAGASRVAAYAGAAVFVTVAVAFSGYLFSTMRAALEGETEQAVRALSPLEMNRPASDLVFENEAGEKVPLSTFKGKPVFLNFWATWCAPCREEMPSIEAMARSSVERGLVVLLVSTDDGWEPIRTFYGDKRTVGVLLRDPGAAGAHSWGTMKYPETYLIDPEFVVRHRFIGPRNWASAFAFRYLEGWI